MTRRAYTPPRLTLLLGDCLERMRELPAASVDAVVTDPPYGLKFMGRKWDSQVPTAAVWAEALRVLKPGGHMLSFFGTRTYHRGVVAIEDAGFEVRDMISWLFYTGRPASKSHLKPGHNPISLAKKPGRGAINIERCRIGTDGGCAFAGGKKRPSKNTYGNGLNGDFSQPVPGLGRWPANVVCDTKSRFFYCAKASPAERGVGNNHPTVKPVALMRWLCHLITPPGGLILDPFLGSGTTGIAALREGFSFIGIEQDPDYLEIARRRIAADAPLLAGAEDANV